MKAIIFGINGQDGIYLKEILEANCVEVIGVSRSIGNWIVGDVANKQFVEILIKREKPNYIFHLAANSTTKHTALFDNHETISSGTFYILEAVKVHSPTTKVFITGSGVQFENNGRPIRETDSFDASSPYSVSRIHSVYAARYFRKMGIKAYVGYLFHHESPYRKHHHISKLTTDFIKSINKGNQNKLLLGDISVKKEWSYAKDIAEGIFTLVNQENKFEATIGTGKVYSIKDWLIECFSFRNLNWEDYIEIESRNFKAEYPLLQSDPQTIIALGWEPKTAFKSLAQIMMK